MIDLRTKKQKDMQVRDKKICDTYKEVRESRPNVPRNRILTAIAQDCGITSERCRQILIANQIY